MNDLETATGPDRTIIATRIAELEQSIFNESAHIAENNKAKWDLGLDQYEDAYKEIQEEINNITSARELGASNG